MLDAPVTYNGVALNTVTTEGLPPGVREGCLLEEFDYGRAQGMGFTEKRAQDDGLDASDVYLGARYISLAGTVYGSSPADLFDRLQSVRTALTPTVAYDVSQPDYGYIPLTFSLPTKDTAFDAGSGPVKQLEFRARPMGQPQFSIRRDTGAFPYGTANGDPSGSIAGEKGGAIAWRAALECKDPRMYVRPDVWIPITAGVTGAPIVNRGDYPAPLDILLGVTSSAANGQVEVDVGGSNMVIFLPSLVNAVVRYSGELKVLTVQASGSTTDTLRMDLLKFNNDTTHPKVSPKSGETYNLRFGGSIVIAAGSRLMYSESFA